MPSAVSGRAGSRRRRGTLRPWRWTPWRVISSRSSAAPPPPICSRSAISSERSSSGRGRAAVVGPPISQPPCRRISRPAANRRSVRGLAEGGIEASSRSRPRNSIKACPSIARSPEAGALVSGSQAPIEAEVIVLFGRSIVRCCACRLSPAAATAVSARRTVSRGRVPARQPAARQLLPVAGLLRPA